MELRNIMIHQALFLFLIGTASVLGGCAMARRPTSAGDELLERYMLQDVFVDKCRHGEGLTHLQSVLDSATLHGERRLVIYVAPALYELAGKARGDDKDPFLHESQIPLGVPPLPRLPRLGGHNVPIRDGLDMYCELTTTKWEKRGDYIVIDIK